MYFDDRLATVLRARVAGEAAANTQYRQLLDLLGTLPPDARGPLVEDGFARLAALAPEIPAQRRAAMVRDPALRLANPQLVMLLAEDEADIASAAMASARLADAQWLVLIPALPVRARGFLRHHREFGPGPARLLARLGVQDLVLTGPEILVEEPHWADPSAAAILSAPLPEPANDSYTSGFESDEIGILLRRIEAFRKARAQVGTSNGMGRDGPADAPRLPLGELPERLATPLPRAFDFATDGAGRINWANPAVAPMVIGLSLAHAQPGAAVEADQATVERMRRRLPVEDGRLALIGAPAIEGSWRIDAVPRFASPNGRFIGYCGRLRRSPVPSLSTDDGEGEWIREMLHELRTPVNAIQGFAEIIQQQLFGPAPHEYRALAAGIAADAAKLLAGFDELDRLARLESGAMDLEDGTSDFTGVLIATAGMLGPYLRGRSARFVVPTIAASAFVPLAKVDAERLAWRLLATLAGAVTPGEQLGLAIATDAQMARFTFDLPASFAGPADIFAAIFQAKTQAVSAGAFGPGFTLRLARAEARAAGGELRHEAETLLLTLPVLTGADADHRDRLPAASGKTRSS